MNTNFSIIWGTRHIRYQQIELYANSAIKLLKGMGVQPGDRIAICDNNSVEYVILLLALWQIKAVAAPISPRWPTRTVNAYLSKINACHLFQKADITRLVCFDARQLVENRPLEDLNIDQEITIIATSGSSGQAKAAVHTWGNHLFSALGSAMHIPLTVDDRWALALPLYHISGLAIAARCLVAGAGMVIYQEEDLMRVIERSRVTHISLVVTQLQRLIWDEKNHTPLRLLKCILLGGSAIPQVLIDRCIELGLNVYVSYGLTEMSSQVATGKVDKTAGSSLKVLPYRQVCISAQGEILVAGEVLFKGYLMGNKIQCDAFREIPDQQQLGLNKTWFATGDRGALDGQGFLTVSGRLDSMFISGGENIYPEEIEQALLNIEGILQAVVVPKEDHEFGYRPIAFIQFESKVLAHSQISSALALILPRFKIPVDFLPWPQDLINKGVKVSRQDFLKGLARF